MAEDNSLILYEDPQILVCHKPPGLAVQSARMGSMDLESVLKNYLAAKGSGRIPYLGVVHRLDQPVEGLVVFAKTPAAAKSLSAQAAGDGMKKYYLAVSAHIPEKKEGVLEHMLFKDGRSHMARVAAPEEKGAKRAVLFYRLLKEVKGLGLFEIRLETGRFHQIRVQMAAAGMPLAGDKKYNLGECEKGWQELGLCAYRLQFTHPKTKKSMKFEITPKGRAFEHLI
ncbi:MAG: RluA family pseudouridine synthase [Blautia sp.]|jgi:23S rRNA pseudouridine1911/1915/1917 synthase